MSPNNVKICRICLKNDKQTNITDATVYCDFFKAIIGRNELPSVIWLCIWCKPAVKKAMNLFTIVLESQKLLANYLDETVTKIASNRQLYNLSYSHNHLDIPPSVVSKNENKIDTIYISTGTIIYEKHISEDEKNDNFDKIEDILFDENICPDKEKCVKVKKRKNEVNYEEMKFKVKYLSCDEQRQELEKKKLSEKYKNMEYKCLDCGVGFLTEDVFSEHRLRHDKAAGPYLCGICQLRFKTSPVLSQHTLAHKRRFTCLLCGVIFNRWTHCVAHRNRCGNVTCPVVCDQCKKIFSDEYSLNVHKRTVHEKVKKYNCVQCNRKFSSKQRLTVHNRTHSGERPFACEQCPRRFATSSNLRAHSVAHAHSRPHYCVECDTHYKSRKALRRHLNESARHLAVACRETNLNKD